MQKTKPQTPDIIILGLGPGDPGLLTQRAAEVINQSNEIYLRTREHPTVTGLPAELRLYSFDQYYLEEESLNKVYQRICDQIISLAQKTPPIVYAVPGDPFIAEDTPAMILARASELNLRVEIVSGVSFLEPTFAALRKDPLPQITILDGLEMQTAHHPPFPVDTPTLIVQIYSPEIASNVKLTLMAVFPDQHPVILIHDAGTEFELLEHIPLFELDRSKHIHNRSAAYIPPIEAGSSLESFQELIAHLRAPEGCPWDREQDHQSLRPNLLEETFEVLEAIDADDSTAMQEELGDLLLQIVLHSQIASEYGEFNMNDVIRGIHRKIIQRHPHVFEDLSLGGEADAVIKNWERIKARERKLNGQEEKSLLDGVPASLPALTQAEIYQKRAARIGFDWKDLAGVLAKIPEEVQELQDAKNSGEQSAEIGDLLFTVVNIARWQQIDAESALREANRRFKTRFSYLEKKAHAAGRELSELTPEEMDQFWDQSKSQLGES